MVIRGKTPEIGEKIATETEGFQRDRPPSYVLSYRATVGVHQN